MNDWGELSQLENDVIFGEWSSHRRSSHRSLGRAGRILEELGLMPGFREMPLLGVVGSKGKGTGAVYAAAALSSSGQRIGMITSPGLVTNRDRIRISGVAVSDTDYRDMLLRLDEAISSVGAVDPGEGYLSPSGLFMLGGLWLMQRAGCRAAVVEAGIGGTSDEISLLPLSGVLLTQIFLEHAEVLGPTITDIARNKAGAIGRQTNFAVSLPQRADVEEVIRRQCADMEVAYYPVHESLVAEDDIQYPAGFSRLNAMGGVRAGTELATRAFPMALNGAQLARTVNSVRYPGRLSVHNEKDGLVVVDSAISRDGLTAALLFFTRLTGGLPAAIYVSIPSNKDYAGIVQELSPLDVRKVFVNMPQSHLPFPAENEWPWEWIELSEMPDRLGKSAVLVAGTATFTAEVLGMLHVDTARVYEAPGN